MESLASSKQQAWLPWFYKGIIVLLLTILFGRLADLQIIRGKYFNNLSENNRIRRVTITAPRGQIYARGGELMASNRDIKKAVVFDKKEGYIKSDQWDEKTADTFITEYLRYYPLGADGAHVTGYLGESKEEEIGKINPACREKGVLESSDLLGKSGLEKYYDCSLRGIDGEELLEVESDGKRVRTLGTKPVRPGSDLKTYIDYGLQKRLAQILKDKSGVAIVSDPNGQVLGLFSTPSFDPNAFNTSDSEKITTILSATDYPLFNRTISGRYPPGSVFKPIVAVAALEEDVIDQNYTYQDTGQIFIDTIYGDFSYKNWYFTQYGGTEGVINLPKALSRSTDTFFYKIGELTGVEKIDIWAQKFGLGNPTSIDLPGEISGIVPSPDWKLKEKGEKWFLGNTYHLSIGQGDLLVTPLEIHRAIASIAARGKLCTPQIAGDITCEDLPISEKTFDSIIEGMTMACSEGGTGYTFFDADPKVACKTGTAQTFDNSEPHSWFTFFAPIEDPQIVVTVMIEHGGEGSKVAGPLAREIYDFVYAHNPQIEQ